MVFLVLLQQLLDSKSKILLLEKLSDRPQAFSVSELARLASLPKATVSGIVSDWEKAGLALCEHQGRNKLVRINQKFYLLPELKKIFSKTADFQAPLLKTLSSLKSLKNKKVKATAVFGSRTKKDFSYQSDLDVLVVLENKDSKIAEEIMEEFSKATVETGIKFYPTLLDSEEMRHRLIEKDQFTQKIIKEGNFLKGRNWIEHLQTTLGSGKRTLPNSN